MKLDELNEEEMYVLVAPDGSPQLSTLAPDFPMCMAMTELLAKSKISQPLLMLFEQGYQILPVKITVKQNGDENTAFNKTIDQIKNDEL